MSVGTSTTRIHIRFQNEYHETILQGISELINVEMIDDREGLVPMWTSTNVIDVGFNIVWDFDAMGWTHRPLLVTFFMVRATFRNTIGQQYTELLWIPFRTDFNPNIEFAFYLTEPTFKEGKDNRLRFLEGGQYRILHDGQTVLVPKGMSTTKPESPEEVPVNLKINGVINNGFFMRPLVNFWNANVKQKLFDRFWLQIWREDLPVDRPDIDWNGDLGINRVLIELTALFQEQSTSAIGSFSGFVWVEHIGNNQWQSDILHFTDANTLRLEGMFRIGFNGIYDGVFKLHLEQLGYIQDERTTLDLGIARCDLVHGNQTQEMLTKNPQLELATILFNYNIRGAE
jgi:hypothetical protein